MPQTISQAPRWYTASVGRTAEVSLLEQSALQTHIALCRVPRSRLSGLSGGARAMQGWVASRFATVSLAVGLLATGWLWLC